MQRARPIVFLSDYGLEDEFVGICHAVIARISPASPVIDLTHGIPPQDVLRGALVLARSIPYLPTDAVLLAVVDPGVGTPRRPVAVETSHGKQLLVGPDNGLMSLAWAERGGVARAFEIAESKVLLEPVSATFHGRDIFAPAAAHLAAGVSVSELGPEVDAASLAVVQPPFPEVETGRIDAEVFGVDRFGNVQLSAALDDLERGGMAGVNRLEVVTPRGTTSVRRAATFGDVTEGEFALIVDSSGRLALVLNRGSAAEALDLAPGDALTIQAPE
ncbi:MAG TPA: SAM-dependent chlorinase/fluorinase [Actinomycetota bacterium]|nr:SAM-dependent chlorinase/fluorinase [Actinomycetota bacterium]